MPRKSYNALMHIFTIFKYYWPHIKRYPKTMYGTLVLFALGALGFKVLAPILYKQAIDIITVSTNPHAVVAAVLSLIILYGVITFLAQTTWTIGNYTMVYTQSNILRDLANDAYKRMQMHSYEFFTNRFVGSLVAKVKRYVDSFETIHDLIAFKIFIEGFTLVGSVIVMFIFSPLLGTVFLVWILMYAAVTTWLIKLKIPLDIAHASAKTKTTGVLADSITNVLNIKMFAAFNFEKNNFAKAALNEEQKRSRTWNFHNHQLFFQGFFAWVFKFGGLLVAVVMWSNGAITAGTVVLMYAYMQEITKIVWDFGRSMSRTVQAFTDAKEMVDIFEQEIDVQDPQSPERCAISKGEIDINNITFAYERSNNVFENFSLKVAMGERIGLVGHSGSGKTTITKLLLRFADVQGGKILIDGQNIAKIKQEDLRRNISYVPQEPMLFHRTLAENIAYANPDASMNEIIDVAKRAHAHEFIKSLPDGYNTLVGERGVKLSGGERQRVAIARAMLKDAPIIILDEATSALDSVSEHYIQDALKTLMHGRTVLVVAHRLSTVQSMDRIVVFENGKIKEEGTHEELLTKRGAYYEFWQQQVNGMLPD